MSSTAAAGLTSFPYIDQNVSDELMVSLEQYLRDHMENGSLPAIDGHAGNTLLHLLVSHKKADVIISKLFKGGLLKSEHLRVVNHAGDTPLHQAARLGSKDVAKVLIEMVAGDHDRERELCSAANSWDETPTYLAAAYGRKEMFDYLKSKTDHCVMLRGRKDGWTILHALVMAEHYDFALQIVKDYPELADRADKEGMTALLILASKPQTFRSSSKYTVINLGLGTFIPLQIIEILAYYCAPSVNWDLVRSSVDDVNNPNEANPSSPSPSPSLFSTFLSALSSGYANIFTPIFTACPAINVVYDTKKKHGYAEILAEKLLKNTKKWRHPASPSEVEIRLRKRKNTNTSGLVRNEMYEQVEERVPLEAAANYENGKNKRVVLDYSEDRQSTEVYDNMEKNINSSITKKRAPCNPLLEAARNRIIELVRLIVENSPEDANATVDEDGKNVLHVVAESKSIYIYEYLVKSKLVKWDMLRLAVDRFGNTIWHHAANIKTAPKVLFGPGNFMTWDTFWFKLVGRDCDPYLQEHRNSNGFTATELYMKNHKSLREDATKEAKDMNMGLMLVSALIGTVNYSALIAIPGGYNQNNGQPIFDQSGSLVSKDLLLFMMYVAGALLASMFALGSQLAIQLSRFLYADYFFSLSFKYLVAMTALFYAASFTVLACAQVFVLQGILKARWYTFFWWPCVCSVLIYIDAMYLTFNHMYFLYLFFCTNKHRRQRSNRGVSKYLY